MSIKPRESYPIRTSSLPPASLLGLVLGLLGVMLVVAFAFATAGATGADPEPRIVGGQEADPGEWPWQVALITPGRNPYEGQFCGGSMIEPGWVLTAAHCVDHEDEGRVDVAAGIFDLRVPEAGFERRSVAEIIVHPGWNPNTNDNDMALLRLSSPIPFRGASGGMLPITGIQLPSPTVGALVGENATVTGWGNTLGQPNPGGTSYPDRLHEVSVPVISNADCNQSYGDITDNMLCAGVPQGGIDSCQGDSGGPLVYFNDAAGRWEQAGVVSFGTGCAAPGFPGVYARVSRYISWIEGEITPPVNVTNCVYLPAQLSPPDSLRRASTPETMPTVGRSLVSAACGSFLANGDFEQGSGGWTEFSSSGFDLIVDELAQGTVSPHSGNWAAWLGGADNELSIISQQVTIPTNSPILSFYYWISSGDACNFDFSGVAINQSNVAVQDLCAATSTNSWVQGLVDLSSFAGQSVTLSLWAETDESVNSNLFIDDVGFQASLTAVNGVSTGRADPSFALPRSGR